MLTTALLLQLIAQAPVSAAWACEGQPPLPAGEPVEFEVGFAPQGQGQNLLEQAKLEGIAQFQRRFCPQSEDCRRSLRSELSSGSSGRNDTGVCVTSKRNTSLLTSSAGV